MGRIGRERLQRLIIMIVLVAFPSFVAAGELRVGVINEKPLKAIEHYNPLAEYVASRLKGFNIAGGKVVVARDVAEMLQKIKNKEVDVVLETAFATVEMREKTGMLPRLLIWKKQLRQYKTLFFVRKDSAIKTLKDLQGKVITFESPRSTSAHAVPKAELRRMGFTVLPEENGARNDAITYVFAKEEINQVFRVLQKKADAGAFSSNDWEETPAKMRDDLRIIHETKPVLRFIASFHPSLSAKLQNALIDIMIVMDKDSEGVKVLEKAQRATKIERLTDDDFKSLEYVKDIIKFVGE